MSQTTRPNSTKKKWPWVAGAAGSVVLLAGAVNAGKSAGQAEAPPAAAAQTTVSTQLATTTVISTSVVVSSVTQVSTAEQVTVTVTVPAVSAGAPVVVEAPVAPAPPTLEEASVTTSAQTSTTTAEAPSGGAYYKNCAAVWAAGKAPIHAGEPGYSTDLDGDSDGIGCEKPPR